MTCRRVDAPPRLLLYIDGVARIDGSPDIADEFRKILASELPELRLDLEGLTDVDVSFLQLILSLSISQARRGRLFAINPLPESHALVGTAKLLGINIENLFARDQKPL